MDGIDRCPFLGVDYGPDTTDVWEAIVHRTRCGMDERVHGSAVVDRTGDAWVLQRFSTIMRMCVIFRA